MEVTALIQTLANVPLDGMELHVKRVSEVCLCVCVWGGGVGGRGVDLLL